MDGNKWRLFCLGFSFIGWNILCVAPILIAAIFITRATLVSGNYATFLWLIPCCIPTFVGALFLMPYQEAAYAAFYRDVSGTTPVALNPAEQDNGPVWDEN